MGYNAIIHMTAGRLLFLQPWKHHAPAAFRHPIAASVPTPAWAAPAARAPPPPPAAAARRGAQGRRRRCRHLALPGQQVAAPAPLGSCPSCCPCGWQGPRTSPRAFPGGRAAGGAARPRCWPEESPGGWARRRGTQLRASCARRRTGRQWRWRGATLRRGSGSRGAGGYGPPPIGQPGAPGRSHGACARQQPNSKQSRTQNRFHKVRARHASTPAATEL